MLGYPINELGREREREGGERTEKRRRRRKEGGVFMLFIKDNDYHTGEKKSYTSPSPTLYILIISFTFTLCHFFLSYFLYNKDAKYQNNYMYHSIT